MDIFATFKSSSIDMYCDDCVVQKKRNQPSKNKYSFLRKPSKVEQRLLEFGFTLTAFLNKLLRPGCKTKQR
jgi:hypothetical protein